MYDVYKRMSSYLSDISSFKKNNKEGEEKKKRVNVTTFIYKSRDLSALGSFVVIKAY